MSNIVIATATRIFTLRGQRIADPNPDLTPEGVRDLLSGTYPELTNAALEGPIYQGDEAVYTFSVKAGTKG